MSVHSISLETLRRTWFVLPDGTIDEIDMRDWDITSAVMVARQLGARYFYRRVAWNPEDRSFDWACYHTLPMPGWVAPLRLGDKGKIAPFKVIRAPDSAPAEMLCRAKAATS